MLCIICFTFYLYTDSTLEATKDLPCSKLALQQDPEADGWTQTDRQTEIKTTVLLG